ncbi:MAG: septum formation protein Maf [Desulfobacterales bacterium RIFOXYA12_FULL_46_15]|nr:MAG: septum formation protein Maf [Desulfobacterales bacterium RIFOXYA12_FULL_46_15]
MKPINLERLLLASRSPRRKELLEQAGMEFEIISSDIDEENMSIKNPVENVKKLSFLKADKVSRVYPDSWILSADTIVVIEDQILGKPESKKHAMEMLRLLSNREHLVFTGFCIMNQKKDIIIKNAVETKVYFKYLSDQEIKWYVNTKEPFDKAGGYGIQGVGAFLVRKILGSYSNVVGLPVCEVVETLMELKIIEMRV